MNVHKRIKLKKIIMLGAVIIFIIILYIMRRYEVSFNIYSNDQKTLDMTIGYDEKDAYQLLNTLGEEGRKLYVEILKVDFIFITCFLYIQNYILGHSMGKLVYHSKWKILLLVSFLRAFFDYIENILLLILIHDIPKRKPILASLLNIITEAKFFSLVIWLAAIPITLYLRRKIKMNGITEIS